MARENKQRRHEQRFGKPERPSGRRAFDSSQRKTSNRTSIGLPRDFVSDGPTGAVPYISRRLKFASHAGSVLCTL
jgi:hypothetical protein